MEGFTCKQEIVVPASHGKAVHVNAGDLLEIVDIDGKQVGDIMAWIDGYEEDEYCSPAHTLTQNWSIRLSKGSILATNKRRAIFDILEDTVGVHDVLVPCCDSEAYLTRYGLHDHRSCLGNIKEALREIGKTFPVRAEMACNLFMNNRIESNGKIVYEEPQHGPGSLMILKCLLPATVALSACPQDQTPTNGWKCSPLKIKLWSPIEPVSTNE